MIGPFRSRTRSRSITARGYPTVAGPTRCVAAGCRSFHRGVVTSSTDSPHRPNQVVTVQTEAWSSSCRNHEGSSARSTPSPPGPPQDAAAAPATSPQLPRCASRRADPRYPRRSTVVPKAVFPGLHWAPTPQLPPAGGLRLSHDKCKQSGRIDDLVKRCSGGVGITCGGFAPRGLGPRADQRRTSSEETSGTPEVSSSRQVNRRRLRYGRPRRRLARRTLTARWGFYVGGACVRACTVVGFVSYSVVGGARNLDCLV